MKKISLLLLFFYATLAFSHPMPNSILMLDIGEKNIQVDAQMPLDDLQLAMNIDLGQTPENQLDSYKIKIQNYLFNHIKINDWNIAIGDLSLNDVTQMASGDYKELTAKITLTPNDIQTLRNFELKYDVILHQVVTHEILVSIRNDWQSGIYSEKSAQMGVISMDIPTNTIQPFSIKCSEGSTWQGFWAMFKLGMNHIAEGTDHLLFLLVLLIPAPLLVENRRWSSYIGLKKSILKLLKIITAFTIGHSITLLLGTLGWIPFSGRWIEILIAFSIIISAIHAIFPIFYKKEMYIAAGFGLIHGLAFSKTLSNMSLSKFQMGLSVLGFNLGIEAMQLFVMLMILPSFLVMCNNSLPFYQKFRTTGAILAIFSATAWMAERSTGNPNYVSIFLQKTPEYSFYIVLGIGLLATWSKFSWRKSAQ